MTSLSDHVQMFHATMEMYSHAKRFNERWLADPAFRTTLFRDPERAISDYALPVDADEMRGIITGDTERAGSIARGIHAISAMKSVLMDRWYGAEATATDPRFAAWRARQQARMRLELGPFQTKASVRAAWNAELTRGCSVGCWFCNMSAKALSGVAPANAQSLEEWRSILLALQTRLGPAMRTGFLDGATDPFDHPAYEAFCRIVLEVAGFFPPTSTALALRDPERSRRFFAEAKRAGCWSVRLTIRDQAELDALHATFATDELAHVQLNTLTPQSSFVFSLAGRYRERFLEDVDFAKRERRKLTFAPWYTRSRDYQEDGSYPIDANTGVVGFTLNMVDRTVSLVAPRPSSATLPLGFQTFDRMTFETVDGFADTIDTLIGRRMKEQLEDADVVRFWTGLRYESMPDGVRLHGKFGQFTDITDPEHWPLIQTIAVRLQRGATVGSILRSDEPNARAATEVLQRFYDNGLLEGTELHD